MTHQKDKNVAYGAATSADALRAYHELHKQAPQSKLVDALDMTHACVLSTLQMRPEIVVDLVRFSDTYLEILSNAVRALGGTGVEIIATFPEGKVTIEKFSR